MSLFDPPSPSSPSSAAPRPLADRMRPERLDDYVGQEHILGPGKPLRVQIERDRPRVTTARRQASMSSAVSALMTRRTRLASKRLMVSPSGP